MDPLLKAVLMSWSWRVEIIVPLLIFGALYVRGWIVLRGRGNSSLATTWRLAAYLGGLLAIVLGLLSPIDTLGSFLFSLHMVQHWLMAMLAPPLLMIANPLPFLMWGLPERGRVLTGRFIYNAIGHKSTGRRWFRALLAPGTTWTIFVIVLWGWHDPDMYNLALEVGWIHDLEHLTFFLTAMLLWWRIVGAGPRIQKPIPLLARVGLAIAGVPPNMILGVFIAFSSKPLYTFYETMPRITSLSVLEDQMYSGLIMWIPGSMMYFMAALIMLFIRMKQEEKKVGKSQQSPRRFLPTANPETPLAYE